MKPRTLLLLSAIAVAVIWQLPYGRQLLYPLSLLATFAHELGHGLSALMLGAHFERLLLHADGSGLALWSGNPSRLDRALIAAGGLVGPSLAGVSVLLLSRWQRLARAVLLALALLALLALLWWVRNPFGVAFVLALATTLGLAAKLLPDAAAAFVLHLIALTLCLSWFTDLDYLFSAQAVVGGVVHPSDSALMAQALGLSYWFWGGVVALVSLVMVLLGIVFACRNATAAKAA